MTEPMHEVVVDGLTYGFRDRETGERFKRAVEAAPVDPLAEELAMLDKKRAEELALAFAEDVEVWNL